jgi:TolA-binding protein
MAQSNYVSALELLKRELPPGRKALDYTYWMGVAYSGKGDYSNAIASCAQVLRDASAEPRLRLSAAFLQAQALSRMEDWRAASEFLSASNGPFQTAARAWPQGREAVSGMFLLGEAWLKLGQFAPAEAAVRQVPTNRLIGEMGWQREYLLCRILLDGGQLEEALAESGSLSAAQSNSTQRISTAFLRGEILEHLQRAPEALLEYSNNLAAGLPPAINRQALSGVIRLSQPQDAIPLLTNFIAARPKDPNLDLAHLDLGEIYLRDYFSPPETNSETSPPLAALTNAPGFNPIPAGTNLLLAAITNLDEVLEFPGSDLLGKARLDRGWCDWAMTNFPQAATNFLQAALRLPYSEDKAVAILKLADAEFRSGDYAGAARDYNTLLSNYNKMEAVTNGLFDLALYQLAQANVLVNNQAGADEAVRHILDWYPGSLFGERSLLLLGEDANLKTNYVRARMVFGMLLQKFPSTPLEAEVQFNIGRTYEQDGDWDRALAAYTNWLENTHFATNANLRPKVEYALALDLGRAGQEAGALAGMSNFVAEFPSHDLAPFAQMWIGDYHMNHAEFGDANFAYQPLFDNKRFTNAGPLAYLAMLMAGYAARHYELNVASNDFYNLVADTNTPAALRQEAYFQLGATDFELFQRSTNEPVRFALLKSAINALKDPEVTNSFLAPQTFGQLGICYLDGAEMQTNAETKAAWLASASNMFQVVLDPRTGADISARGQAQFGLGLVAKRLGLASEESFYLPLIEADADESDPFWLEQAGVAAAQLEESKQNWNGAIHVYERVRKAVPSLAPDMERYIAAARARKAASGN